MSINKIRYFMQNLKQNRLFSFHNIIRSKGCPLSCSFLASVWKIFRQHICTRLLNIAKCNLKVSFMFFKLHSSKFNYAYSLNESAHITAGWFAFYSCTSHCLFIYSVLHTAVIVNMPNSILEWTMLMESLMKGFANSIKLRALNGEAVNANVSLHCLSWIRLIHIGPQDLALVRLYMACQNNKRKIRISCFSAISIPNSTSTIA